MNRKLSASIILYALLVTACGHIIRNGDGVNDDPPKVGFTFVSGTLIGPLVITRSRISIPGTRPVTGMQGASHACTDTPYIIVLKYHSRTPEELLHTCKVARLAIEYATPSSLLGRIEYEVHLPPQDYRFSADFSNWGWRSAKLVLAAPWFEDVSMRYGNIADLVSHETYHLAGALAGNPKASNEKYAYYVGLCGQLAANGRIVADMAPGNAIENSTGPVLESSTAALQVRHEIHGYFENGEILNSSKGAKMITDKCSEAF